MIESLLDLTNRAKNKPNSIPKSVNELFTQQKTDTLRKMCFVQMKQASNTGVQQSKYI